MNIPVCGSYPDRCGRKRDQPLGRRAEGRGPLRGGGAACALAQGPRPHRPQLPRAARLDRLAQVARVSKYHFARRFEATYKARHQSDTSSAHRAGAGPAPCRELTVTEVCMAVGFTSLGSFSTRFTQLVGETPTAYRDRWAARGGPDRTTDWNAHRAPCDCGVDARAGGLVTASVSGRWRGGNTCPTLGATRPVGTERDTT